MRDGDATVYWREYLRTNADFRPLGLVREGKESREGQGDIGKGTGGYGYWAKHGLEPHYEEA